MKKIFWISLYILMISACASQPSSPYKAAKGNGYGYKEKILGANRYSVEFKIANGNVKKAEDYAILRAAELTISQGYDWFEVKKRYVQDDQRDQKVNGSDIYPREQISHECGLLSCTQIHDMADAELDKDTLLSEASVVVEISFGKGISPAKQNIYDALETSETLRTKLGVL
jgi:hypothetical protein